MIAIILCIVLMIIIPGASLALIFSPLLIILAVGLIVILFLVKK